MTKILEEAMWWFRKAYQQLTSEMDESIAELYQSLNRKAEDGLRLKSMKMEEVRAKVETELQMKIDELAARTVMDSKSAREFTVTTNGGVIRTVKAVRWNVTEGMVIAVGQNHDVAMMLPQTNVRLIALTKEEEHHG